MGAYVAIGNALGLGPQWIIVPQDVPGLVTQPVVQFSPALNVAQGTIVIPANCPLPNALAIGTVWLAPPGYWVAMTNTTLPASLTDGQGTDALHYSRGPSSG